jgi:hypothetical protein
MRLWSVHPKYLDAKGLVALWREGLLAKKVLEHNTKGYRNHPQLHRFKNCKVPLHAINHYLSTVYEEAGKRNYQFDRAKIDWVFEPVRINVTEGQLIYEMEHLKGKLQERFPPGFARLKAIAAIEVNPVFDVVSGGVEDWEIQNT